MYDCSVYCRCFLELLAVIEFYTGNFYCQYYILHGQLLAHIVLYFIFLLFLLTEQINDDDDDS